MITLLPVLAGAFLATNRPAYSAIHGVSTRYPAAADPAAIALSYVSQTRADDELVEMAPGVWIKSSNVYGVVVGGTRYYYRVAGHTSYDPWSRGTVTSDQIRIVGVAEEPGFNISVYIILGPHAGDRQL